MRARAHGLRRADGANAELAARQLDRDCALVPADRAWLEAAVEKLGGSARAFHRILRVSRTIADLADEKTVGRYHLAEALQFRRA
jgi:magnesium chelatase family protein